MPALSCSAMTCVYNQNELCSKGDIRVGGSGAKSSMETCCESFKERGDVQLHRLRLYENRCRLQGAELYL